MESKDADLIKKTMAAYSKELMGAFSGISRQLEYINIEVFNLSQLLLSKGLITKKEYDEYCSNEAIMEMYNLINNTLDKEEENAN